MTKLILDNHEKILCNIHGHTHDGAFMQNMWKPFDPLYAINPGALDQGDFCELVLTYKVGENKWKITEANRFFLT